MTPADGAADPRDALRALPRVDDLVAASADLVARYGVQPTTEALRAALDAHRATVRAGAATPAGEPPGTDALRRQAQVALARRRPGPPQRVINASGVVVHTNLGRAPLSAAALEAVIGAAGACDLELDLTTGRRGARGARLDPLLADACRAEDAMAVNSCAGALVLVLAALGAGREVVVSRGELVEIGGSFRLPEIMAASGARLVEVGTTNRTRASDYRAGDAVALLLVVHRSNFRQEGFVASPTIAEVAGVARERGVPLVHDTGSGLLRPVPDPWAHDEPVVSTSLEDGAALAVCSGDKLLGGPQAGLIAGRADLVDRCRRHPLARALRLDKLRIAALVATVEGALRGDDPPVLAALRQDAEVLLRRAADLAGRAGGTVVEAVTLVGGGSAPEAGVESPVVRLSLGPAPAGAVATALRQGVPPVVARVADGAVLLDLRTVAPEDDDVLTAAVLSALRAVGADRGGDG